MYIGGASRIRTIADGTLGRVSIRLLQSAAICALSGVAALYPQSALSQIVQEQGSKSSAARQFNIAAQPLTSALNQFGRQSGLQVSFPAEASQGLRSNAVIGSFTPERALAALLRGTGISYRISEGTAVIGGRPSSNVSDAGAVPRADGSLILDTINVAGQGDRNASSGSGFQGSPDWVYQTPDSISVVSRQAIQNQPARNTRDLLSGVPGVLVSDDNAQNQGINVNIRGLQDQGRVAMMIDGARQDFQRNGHGSTGYMYVEPSFLREIDVEKSGTSTMGGAAMLGGSVNFRTIGAEDLISPGKQVGGFVDATTGTNAYHFNGSAAVAAKASDSFSILGGLSYKNLGEYDIGRNGKLPVGSLGTDGPLLFMGSESWSGLLKTQMRPTEDTSLDISWLHYATRFKQGAGRDVPDDNHVTNDTVAAAFGWKPDSDLIDLKGRLWFNRADDRSKVPQQSALVPATDNDYKMSSWGGSLENTSRFVLPLGKLALNYGLEAWRDLGDTVARGPGVDSDPNQAWWFKGLTPSGRRDVISGFGNVSYDVTEWLTLSSGLRYDHYHSEGSTTVFGVRTIEVPGVCGLYYPPSRGGGCRIWTVYPHTETTSAPYNVDIDKSGGAWLPAAKIAIKPIDGVELFTKYSQTSRPPSVMETFTGGTHPGGGFTNALYAPNPGLVPERANTYEVGANLSYDSIIQAGDTFRAKVVGFHRDVNDYIALGQIAFAPGSATTQSYNAYVNLDGPTRMNGVELEANYDAGDYYLGGSFSYINAKYASAYSYNGTSQTTGSLVIFVPPKEKLVLDSGVRLFDRKLTIGGRVSHFGKANGNIGGYGLQGEYNTNAYTLFDLYGSYAINDSATLRFAVNNITDVAYIPALGFDTYPGPGRTATVSLNMKF